MLRRLGIRAKVLAVLAVPVLVLLVAAGYIALQSVQEARTAAAVRDVVSVMPLYSRAAEALQQERTLSVQEASDSALGGNLTISRSATDDAIGALGVALRGLDLSTLDTRVSEAIQDASNQHIRLVEIRDRVDAGSLPASLVSSNYTDILSADNDVPVVVAETLSERSLASRMSAYGAIADTVEQVLRAQPVAGEVLTSNGADPAQVRELASLFAVQDEARDDARALTNGLRLPGIQLASRDADLTAMQLQLASGNELTVRALDPTRWNSLVNAELASLRPVGSEVLTSADDRAGTIADQARDRALITGGIAAAAAALSILIALVVSRGIVIPMRRLTAAAGTVRVELPKLVEQVAVPGETPDLTLANIPVESQDEVGRLAQAFNDVNATTIQVAREQAALRGSIAEMFVNVARRDQVLLGRQLAFIDSLERSEEDPATLANLFRLDHLATRMRRNAESLLVLAGIDSGRRLREAMPLSDVVRTASSEIEQYDRVQLDLGADPLMHGFNALAAAHLLAELLENATLFSEPGTPVVVATSVDDEHVLVRITDQGLGMSPDELSAANTTISSTSPTEALGAQRLGLFVVARLGQRLGARVRLERAQGSGVSGTVAVVEFPVALFTSHDPALAGGLPGARRSGAPATGSLPAVEAPVAVPVDLAALTDGATTTGLPRRRTSGDAADPAAPAASAASARSAGLPAEQDVVLPAPAEATLAPEIAAEAGGWSPLVAPAPSAPGGLPSRGLPARGAAAAPAGPVADAGEAGQPAAGPRAGLFAGFRGRDALPAAAPGEDVAGDAPEVPEVPAVPALAWAPDDADEPAAEAVAPVEPQPLVVPGLVPDEPLDESRAWGDWGQAAHEPAEPVVPVVPGLAAWDADAPGRADETQVLRPVADEAAEPPASDGLGGLPVASPMLASPEPEPEPAPTPVPFAGLPAAGWLPDAPEADAVPLEPAPPAPALPEPALPAPAPVAASGPALPPVLGAAASEAPAPLPDFATLVRGDDPADAPEPARRGRARRSFFSFRRKAAERPETPAAAPAPAPVPVAAPVAAPDPARASVLPPRSARGAHAGPSEPDAPGSRPPTAPRGIHVAALGAPVEPVEPLGTGLAQQPGQPEQAAAPAGWLPSTGWAPTEDAVPAPAPGPAQPAWSAPSAWSAPVPDAPADAPAVVLPEPPALGAWAPDAGTEAGPWAVAQPSADAAAPLPTRTRGEVPPPAPEPESAPAAERRPPRDISTWASAWSPQGQPAVPHPGAPGWSAGGEQDAASSEPAPAAGHAGGLDAEAAAMLALRADIQEQALSELSQLSAYRPKIDTRPAGGSLTRRVPTAIPAAPEISAPEPGRAPERDADGLRDRLASFQSGSRRGRRALADADPSGTVPEQPVEHDQQQTSPSW
ncbi:nitrate- and nitrite sensing domain-containing protein [Cellulomonas hominis]|uniref:sensor histidine kinase n=1 Tax=Cellulomonas hominis TaxID=156981 RepID=UPI001C0F91CA|nr:nitrate- and nitrite sensing domain-containing protein [Cellulomonas hominis]MBU5421065.1 nitrate- and nitrite sensing domain-containing protein [Cellulomonas hominis]